MVGESPTGKTLKFWWSPQNHPGSVRVAQPCVKTPYYWGAQIDADRPVNVTGNNSERSLTTVSAAFGATK